MKKFLIATMMACALAFTLSTVVPEIIDSNTPTVAVDTGPAMPDVLYEYSVTNPPIVYDYNVYYNHDTGQPAAIQSPRTPGKSANYYTLINDQRYDGIIANYVDTGIDYPRGSMAIESVGNQLIGATGQRISHDAPVG
jgi:hypothetical protein